MQEVLVTQYILDVTNVFVSLFKELDDGYQYTRDISKSVQINVLFAKLEKYVEQFDKEQAIQYSAAIGRDQKTLETGIHGTALEPYCISFDLTGEVEKDANI